MRLPILSLLLAGAVPLAAASPAPAPVSALIRTVRIPYGQFTLPNGLRVIVHTDRKAPVVAISVWYHVGSGSEPAGKTGYAHLYEHLMFNGSENAPGDFFEPLQQVGATDSNGTTSFDRTNYFETVPTNALDRALWLESDRMGHMLGAITQANLDNQIGVVQNEKRQGDNQPYGLFRYKLAELFPRDHPYGHTTIGSMADLSAARLDDVKGWFRDNYGPDNAVLVLAGDIDLAGARRLVTRYFGDIPRSRRLTRRAVPVAALPTARSETIHDRVATTRIYRLWPIPALTDRDAPLLEVASGVLGGLASSRLDSVLVRGEKLAVNVGTGSSALEQGGYFTLVADVRPGVDPALVGRRIDAVLADFLRTGPTADEVNRVATSTVAGRIRGLEQVGGFGGKAVALAQGALYADDPDFYRKQLQAIAVATPAAVRAAAARWLGKPAYQLTIAPGVREPYEPAAPARPAAAAIAKAEAAARPIGRGGMPPVGDPLPLRFPAIERTTLADGIGVVYAQRSAVPVTRVALSFDAGNAADPKDAPGTQSLMLALLDEGTKTRSSQAIAEEQERLGMTLGGGPSMDRTILDMTALSANLAPSLDLFADVVRNPAFAPAEVERLRARQLAGIAQELTTPAGIAGRVIPPILFGAGHPYGVPFGGSGDPAVVRTLTPAQLAAFHDAWLRPETATLFVVSDRPLAALKPLLEAKIGTWRPPATPPGRKRLATAVPAPRPRILLVDRPQSPQSLVMAGEILPLRGTDAGIEAIGLANDALAGTFLGRVNQDLREEKGWTYGANGGVRLMVGALPYLLSAPVQADKTGPAIGAARADIGDFLTTKGITAAERERAINNRVRSLPGSFETSAALLSALQAIDTYKRPDDYYARLPALYRSLSTRNLDAAIRNALDPDRLVWVVVGDANAIGTQLDTLGLPIERVANPATEMRQ